MNLSNDRCSRRRCERRERERQVLRLLVRGEQEIAAGDGHDLDDVLAEADAILARDRS